MIFEIEDGLSHKGFELGLSKKASEHQASRLNEKGVKVSYFRFRKGGFLQ